MNKIFYFSLGCIFFTLGTIGIFLPIPSTTCFWLLAALAFSKSSRRFYQKLIEHKKFEPIYANWQRDKSVSIKVKQFALTSILLSMIVSCLILTGQFTAQVMVICTMLLCLNLLDSSSYQCKRISRTKEISQA